MLEILVGDLVSMTATSIVAGCLNSIAGIARVPLLLGPSISWIIVDGSSLSHVLISILSTQSSSSAICGNAIPLYFIHYHIHILTVLCSLNPANLVARYSLIRKTLFHLHRTGNFGITLNSMWHLLEIIINVYLGTSSLTRNVLIEIDHLWGFFVQLIHNLSSDLVSKKFIFLKISIHVFQFLLDQLIFHYVSFDTCCKLISLILMNYMGIVLLVLVPSWKSLANIYVAECASKVSRYFTIRWLVIITLHRRLWMRRCLAHWWLLFHRACSLWFPVMVLWDIVREGLMMLLVLSSNCEAADSLILVLEMFTGWGERILDALLCSRHRIGSRIWWDETRANIVYRSMSSFISICSLFIKAQLEIVIVKYLLISCVIPLSATIDGATLRHSSVAILL